MWRDIRIGLFAEAAGSEGWLRVLRQEMLPWDLVDGPDRPVILFDGWLPAWCAGFVAGGGVAVISGAPASDALFGSSVTASLLRFRPPEREREAVMPCLARLFRGPGYGECRLHENRKARAGQLADIRPAVLVRSHGEGWLVFTGLPLAQHLAAGGDSLRAFADLSGVTERVASVDKAEIVDTLTWMLRQAFAKLSLPYVRLARYPNAARSVFLFRVDVDGLFGGNCQRIADVAQAHGISGSFYFNASLCRSCPGVLSRDWLASHEIGHHADRHDLFDSVEENRENLLAGMAWVKQSLGVRTTGYVAPRGLWNHALDTAMAELGHVYSSDFGLDFDSLPFLTPARVLQVPVHPFSPERYAIHQEDNGLGPPDARAVLDHYLSALERQVALCRPAHLYGHPEVLGRMAQTVLPDLFAAVARLKIPNMTVGAFADWWLGRAKANLALRVNDATGAIVVETTGEAVEACASAPTRLTMGADTRDLIADQWTVLPPVDEIGF